MNNELKGTIAYYIKKYGKTFDRKLGLTRDDLLNDIREQIWKGLVTHDVNGKAQLKTYLNTLIKNRIGVLADRASLTKYNSIEYFADVYGLNDTAREGTEAEESGEMVFERRQQLMSSITAMSKIERTIFSDLMLGFTIDEMMTRNKLSREQVIGAINHIDKRIKDNKA